MKRLGVGPKAIELFEEQIGQVFGVVELLVGGDHGGDSLGKAVFKPFGLFGFPVHHAILLTSTMGAG